MTCFQYEILEPRAHVRPIALTAVNHPPYCDHACSNTASSSYNMK